MKYAGQVGIPICYEGLDHDAFAGRPSFMNCCKLIHNNSWKTQAINFADVH